MNRFLLQNCNIVDFRGVTVTCKSKGFLHTLGIMDYWMLVESRVKELENQGH